MVLHFLIGLLATAVLLSAGLAVALTWQPEPSDDDTPLYHVLLALGWGFGLIPFMAFCVALFGKVALDPTLTLGVATLVGVGAGAFWWTRLDKRVPVQLLTGWGSARGVLLLGAGVAAVYLLKYDRSVFFLESCIHRVVMQTMQLTDNPIDILASNADDQRLGNTSVISSFVVLYRGLGFRVLYAFVGFITTVGGYLLGRRVLGSNRWGWFVAIVLPLNPYVAKIPLLDENLLTMGYCSLFLPLFLRQRVPWAHAGALLGLAIMMRHVAILSVPAVLWAVWVHVETRPRERLRALGAGLATFTLVTLPGHIHHYMALGSVFKFESFGQIPEFPHNIVGNYSGLLQFPFADEIIRTPWNPLPTFLMWPVYLADHLGLILFSAMLIGVVWLVRTRRKEGVFWIAWFVLPYLALSLQENWDVPNKMGVIYTLFHAFVLWSGAGLKAAFDHPKRAGVALVAVALVSGFSIRSLNHLHVKADVRYYQAWQGEREEDPAYVMDERDRVTNVAPWPDFGRMGSSSLLFHPAKWTGLWRDLSDPTIDRAGTPYGWFPGEQIDPSAPPALVTIQLGKRLFDASEPFVIAADPNRVPDVDLTRPGPPVVIPNLKVPWSPRPVSVLLSRGGAKTTGMSLIFERWGSDEKRLLHLHERYHRGLMMVLGWGLDDMLEAKVIKLEGAEFTLKLPAGPFSIVESVNNAGQNYLFWRTTVAASAAVDLEGPYRVFHN